MSKRVTCPKCQQAMRLPDTLTATSVRCPKCQAVFSVGAALAAAAPQPAASVRPGAVSAANCPQCGKAFGVSAGFAEQRAGCPHCRAELLVREEKGCATALLAPPRLAAVAEGGADPLGFLSSSPGVSTAAPSALAATKKSASRYRAKPGDHGAPTHDCVIRSFLCDEDATVGRSIANAMREILAKEDCLASVSVSDDSNQWGKKVTVDDCIASVAATPGGFLAKASCAISTQATVILDDGRRLSTSGMAKGEGGNASSMLKACTKTCAKKMAADVLKGAAGYKHLTQDLSTLATCCLVFGILSWIPGVGFLFFAVAAILGLIAFLFNSERAKKIGMPRVAIGLGFGVVAVVVWIIVFNTSRF